MQQLQLILPVNAKQCRKCQAVKPLTEFPKNRGAKDGLHHWCKACAKEHTRRRWEESPEVRIAHRETVRRYKARLAGKEPPREPRTRYELPDATETVAVKPKRRKSFETLVLFHLVKTAVGCQVCGERDPVVIDFHHVDPATKSFGLNARGTRTHVNEQRIVDELKKCVCLCANCHRRHHNGGLDVTGLALIDEATILQAITRMLSHATP